MAVDAGTGRHWLVGAMLVLTAAFRLEAASAARLGPRHVHRCRGGALLLRVNAPLAAVTVPAVFAAGFGGQRRRVGYEP